jgi:hypothetical protein
MALPAASYAAAESRRCAYRTPARGEAARGVARSVLKCRRDRDLIELSTFWQQLKMLSADGKQHLFKAAYEAGLLCEGKEWFSLCT